MAGERYRQALRDKVAHLVRVQFGGDRRAAFRHYDANRDGAISKDELEALLGDAGVRGAWIRWAWASVIFVEIDADMDGLISWPEFAAGFELGNQQEPDPPRPTPATERDRARPRCRGIAASFSIGVRP